MSINIFLEAAEHEFENYKNLPLGVYLTHKSGVIVDFNIDAAHLLKLREEDRGTANISHFYSRPSERERLISKLESCPNGHWERNQTLNFVVEGQTISLRFFAKTYKDENERLLGSLCLVFRITEFERFRQLEENIPIGFFEISERNEITYTNSRFRQILGIKETDKNHNMLDFFPDLAAKEKYLSLIRQLRETQLIKDEIIDLVKGDDIHIAGKISVVVEEMDLLNGRNYILKTKGFLEDVTFNDILHNVPVGLFSIIQSSNNLRVSHCNTHFAAIFDKQNIQACIGVNLDSLINNNTDFDNLRKKIVTLGHENQLIKNLPLKIRTNDNREKDLIFYVERSNNTDRMIRYTGAVFEVTHDVERKLARWRQDFASFLHSYAATCNSIKDTLQSIIDANNTEAVKNEKIDTEVAYKRMRDHITGFKNCYAQYYLIATKRLDYESNNVIIGNYVKRLKLDESEELTKVSIAKIRNIFIKIRPYVNNVEFNKVMPKEIVKAVNNEISEIFRYARLLSLYYLENELYEKTIDIDSYKEALRDDFLIPVFNKFNLFDPFKDAIRNLQEFAERRSVEISKIPFPAIQIKGDERSLYWAFYNVIHNAIKYSWIKPDEKKSWVSIDMEQHLSSVHIIIESRGVGIHRAEIDSNKIFEFGNRGLISSDRNRKGNGIGLWHSKKIITEFNGEISIESDPIDKNFPDDFKKPFLTKVVLKFPIKQPLI